MNEFLSYHFYVYFKIEGYIAAVLSKECAQAERGMPKYDKNLDPHSLFPLRCKASAISDAKVCCRTYPLWEPLGDTSLVSALGSPLPFVLTTFI